MMVQDILGSAAVGKLKGILHDRYGKNLRVSFMREVSSLEIKEDTFLLARGDLHIPIQVNDKYLATAIVDQGADLRKEDQEVVSQLVRLFMEPELFNWYVEQMTQNLKAQSTDNVVSLHEAYIDEDEDDDLDEGSERTALSTNVLCLSAQNPNLIPRMAQNVHDISERWAYLRFSEIQSGIKTVDDIKSLGSLTLFVDDILQLDSEMQELIYKYLSNSIPSEEPLMLIGASTPLEDLEAQNMIHSGLAKILHIHQLEIERLPRDPKLLQETLEIMLEF